MRSPDRAHCYEAAAVGGGRAGMALPLMLFLIVMLTVLAAGALTVSSVERRVLGANAVQLDAYALARAGLEHFFSSRANLGFTSAPPAVAESARVALSGGYADVVLTRLRDARPMEPALYVIRARGVRTDGSRPPQPLAERSVAQLARWQDPSMQVLAGWTSLPGVSWMNAAGTVSGVDACHGAAAVAGVAVPNGLFSQPHGAPVPTGSPDTLNLGASQQARDAVMIDWPGVLNTGLSGATVHWPSDPWPSALQWSSATYWPVIIAQGDLTLPTDGRGLLAVTGNLSLTGGRTWDGVILVGGEVYERTGNTVRGALVSGLNLKFGGAPASTDSVKGNFRVYYNSCNVAQALAPFAGLSPYRNAMVDNWP